ncbi:copper chaperone PCu(A)C [Phaeacidiphilus oryzae]|uniref:copper chaperone PCu(A)C n=1 Tax=Phaeacidiphilus oryzae TaxID=348818 RepID=UPI000560447C|nr:copper chaperone PCu(A)C [Phaeacidiphilus oryzae]
MSARRHLAGTAAAGAGLALAITLTGCSGASAGGTGATGAATATGGAPARLSVSGSYIPQPASADMAAGYFTVRNSGGTPDTLLSASSPDAGSVTLHQSTDSTMTPLKSATVPAHGSLVFARGGKHLMLMGLKRRPVVGGKVELRLTFRHSGTLTVEAPVEPLTYQPNGRQSP